MTTWRRVTRVSVMRSLKETPDISKFCDQPPIIVESPSTEYRLKIFGDPPKPGKVGMAPVGGAAVSEEQETITNESVRTAMRNMAGA